MQVNRPGEPAFAGLGTFAKLPLVLEADELGDVDVAVFGAPMDDLVTNRPGARYGPRAIRLAYDEGAPPRALHMDLGVNPFAKLRIVDHGDAVVTPGDPEASHREIAKGVASIVGAGAAPVLLGGDHSVSYPSIRAVADNLPKDSLAVVHFDAHTDTARENFGVEWAHGTPFRNLVDQGHIRGERLVQVGLRGYWPGPEEWEWAREAGVRWHRMERIVEKGIDAVMRSVVYEVGDAEHVYLSVDVDALDPAYAPGTGTPEPGGMTTRELLRAVRRVVLERGLAGMDVVEVAPVYDHSGITALAAYRVAPEALAALACHRGGAVARPQDP